jgi:hypothetical protein
MSRVKATIQAERPDNIMMTMTTTMSLSDWKSLLSQIPSTASFPGWKFREMIYKLVSKADEHFTETTEVEH